jgi:glutamate dehydrogenase
MASRKNSRADREQIAALEPILAASLLPGDPAFTGQSLAEAAHFVLATARDRAACQTVLALESVAGPVGARQTRIAVVTENMPFLVDSVVNAVTALGLAINRLIHPVIEAARDAQGRLRCVGPANGKETRESIVYIEAARADARTRVRLRASIESAIEDVRAAVTDWSAMQAALSADAARADQLGSHGAEDAALLRWLRDGNLTQLGHVTRRRDGRQSGSLGICRKSSRALLAPESFMRAFAWFDANRDRTLLIVKANRISQVHRRTPLDLFIVPLYDKGSLTGLSVHAAIWTSTGLAASPGQMPRLRTQLATLMTGLGFEPQGHAGKALVHALTRLPHDLVIAFEDADLQRVATSMMSLIDRPRPRLILVQATLGRHLFAFVWLPRDAVSTAVRQEITAMLEQAAGAQVLDWSLEVESSSLALLRFVLDIRSSSAVPDENALDERVKALVRGWQEAVEAELAAIEDPARAAALAARYAPAFPLAYRTTAGAAEAAQDITRLRRLSAVEGVLAQGRDARISCPPGGEPGQLRLKLYCRQGALALSDAVPMLENFGFRVEDEVPTVLQGGELGAIHDFCVQLPIGAECAGVTARARIIEQAIGDVLNNRAENDPFNRLIVAGGLGPAQANWLRAWYRYLRQATTTFGIQTAVDALLAAPKVARGLIDLFVARHDPDVTGDRKKAESLAEDAIREGLGMVAAINDDRLLRQYRALVGAVLRTNAFDNPAADDLGAALAFKIESACVPGLPRPVPWREIFVYSRRVEGIHLRAGAVARGGLRWSDRRDDFRTEVLGLMKAQRVKNAVIVPTGAKGGFFPKQLPDPAKGRDAWLAEGKASYQVFVRSLLSLTDNIVGGKVVHPARMVIRDGEDPYFVVAADKGTATYSDSANAIAASLDFWLDDAFASGGSNGYDHKAMGITARGAWLSAQRHFRELGVDIQSEPVRVAGCGDMSGDVFGNGMLLSQTLRLVAAFDHRHIFIDPDPDPALSWAERKRLFALPRSSWDDYDKSLISKGGGVWPRSLKSIPLIAETRAALDFAGDSADPEALIAAILKSPVDLLWFGGIGTYVKAASENNIQVGDPANDGLRINGAQVRARVIGEGANLGCTQAGRIEFALAGGDGSGGRINTDFIDNSAGVDCSDKEVNIKIALASARRDGRLGDKARTALLARMTDEVAGLVLEDNRLQALALSIAQSAGELGTGAFIHLIESLEERGELDRATDGIADNATLLRRAGDGQGLTRPELAVLLSSAKLALQQSIEGSGLPEDPGLTDELLAAFPKLMRGRYAKDILAHRLRREIIATRLANRMINRIGMIHPFELTTQEGATLPQVAGAFVAAEQLLGLPRLWERIESAAMPEPARILLMRRTSAAARLHMADLVRAGAGRTQPTALVEALAGGVAALRGPGAGLIGPDARGSSSPLHDELAAAGAPDDLADDVMRLYALDGVVGLAALARDLGAPPVPLAGGFLELGARLGLDWAQAAAARLAPSDPWDRLLVAGLARDFQQMRLDFLRRRSGTGDAPAALVARWAQDQAAEVRQFLVVVNRARGAVSLKPTMLAQLAGQARNLLSR